MADHRCRRLAGLLGIALAATAAAARGETLGFAGFEAGDRTGYAYVGALGTFPGSSFGSGWVWRNWLDWLAYEYESTGTIKAKAVALTPAIVHQFSGEAGSLGLSIGVRLGHTRLAPDDESNRNRGFRVGVPLQIDVERNLTPSTRLAAIATRDLRTGGYWSRLRLTSSIGASGLVVGPEVIWKGSHEYRAYQVGAFLGNLRIAPRTELGLKLGYSRQRDAGSGAYGGVELVHGF